MNHSQLLLHWHNRCKHRSSCIWHLVINITICYHVSYEKIYIPLEFPNGFDNLGFTTLCQRYKPQELEDKFSEKVTYFRTNVVWRVGWASKFFFFLQFKWITFNCKTHVTAIFPMITSSACLAHLSTIYTSLNRQGHAS